MNINPDCKVGKHHACSGTAWNEQTDTRTDCGCACHEYAVELDYDEVAA